MSSNPTPFYGSVFTAEAPQGNIFFGDKEKERRGMGGGPTAAALSGYGGYKAVEGLIQSKGLPAHLVTAEMRKGWKKDKHGTGQRPMKATAKSMKTLRRGIDQMDDRMVTQYEQIKNNKRKVEKHNKKVKQITGSSGMKKVKGFDRAEARLISKYGKGAKIGGGVLGAGLTIAALAGQRKKREFSINEAVTEFAGGYVRTPYGVQKETGASGHLDRNAGAYIGGMLVPVVGAIPGHLIDRGRKKKNKARTAYEPMMAPQFGKGRPTPSRQAVVGLSSSIANEAVTELGAVRKILRNHGGKLAAAGAITGAALMPQGKESKRWYGAVDRELPLQAADEVRISRAGLFSPKRKAAMASYRNSDRRLDRAEERMQKNTYWGRGIGAGTAAGALAGGLITRGKMGGAPGALGGAAAGFLSGAMVGQKIDRKPKRMSFSIADEAVTELGALGDFLKKTLKKGAPSMKGGGRSKLGTVPPNPNYKPPGGGRDTVPLKQDRKLSFRQKFKKRYVNNATSGAGGMKMY